MGNIIILLLALAFGVWAYNDAKILREEGARLTPAMWGIIVFLFPLLALIFYIILCRTLYRRQIQETSQIREKPHQ